MVPGRAAAVWHLRDILAEAIDVTIRQFEHFQRERFFRCLETRIQRLVHVNAQALAMTCRLSIEIF